MKTGIVTIYDMLNYGNRLQNYALSRTLTDLGMTVVTIPDLPRRYEKSVLYAGKHWVSQILKPILPNKEKRRYAAFEQFTRRNIRTVPWNYRRRRNRHNDHMDTVVVGSDQIWNPFFDHLSEYDTLEFVKGEGVNGIAYAASFGVDDLPEEYAPKLRQIANNFSYLSVREESGKKILEKYTERKDVEVLIDPTLLLEPSEWDAVSRKPKQFGDENYLLLYFLGDLSEERRAVIRDYAKEQDLRIVELMDKKSVCYTFGPAEFLWCVSHAECVLTDSYHGSIFSFLYGKPFLVYDREDKNKDMSSRLDTLLSTFGLENRKYPGELSKEQLLHDYSDAYVVLEQERMKTHEFLKKAFSGR